jgi:hypothetical protein
MSSYTNTNVSEDDIESLLGDLDIPSDHTEVIKKYTSDDLTSEEEVEIDAIFIEHPNLRDSVRELMD